MCQLLGSNTVQARSGNSSTAAVQAVVNVSVLDINDNCPVFVGVPYYTMVPINATRGAVIFKACGRFGSQHVNTVRGKYRLYIWV